MSELFKLFTFILLMNGECRGEPIAGQIAVAQVVFNRGISDSTLIYKQFNCFNNNKIRKALLKGKEKIIIDEILKEVATTDIIKFILIYQYKPILKVISDDSYYYWTKKSDKAMKKKHKNWFKKLKHTKTINNHKFYKKERIK